MKKLISIIPLILLSIIYGCDNSSENKPEYFIPENYHGRVMNWDKGSGYSAKYVYENPQISEPLLFPIDADGIFEMKLPDTLSEAGLLNITEFLGLPDSVLYGWESFDFKIMYGSFILTKDGTDLGPLFHYQKSGDTIISPAYDLLIYANNNATVRGYETVKEGNKNITKFMDFKLAKGWNKILKSNIVKNDTLTEDNYVLGTGNLFNFFYYND